MGVSPGDADDIYYSDILVPKLKDAKWVFMQHGSAHSRIDSFVNRHKINNYEIRKW